MSTKITKLEMERDGVKIPVNLETDAVLVLAASPKTRELIYVMHTEDANEDTIYALRIGVKDVESAYCLVEKGMHLNQAFAEVLGKRLRGIKKKEEG